MPQRRSRSRGSTPVEAITHAERRANLPLSGEEAREFVTDDIEQPIAVRYPRDLTLDPQLVWKGKDELDGTDLLAEAPAIYIQEKIDPRVLIENLRRATSRRKDLPELTLFDDFDGLPALDLVDYYRHQANWSNRMILGDSLNVMASLAEREGLRGQVQMIYMDPPYGIDFKSNWQVSARSRSVKDGDLADASREVEQIKAFRDTWAKGIHSYLSYLRDRLLVAHDLLRPTGSLFVQIGSQNAHLVATLLAEVFGPENHVETIAFRKKTMPLGGRLLEGAYDYLVWFARDKETIKYRGLFQPKDVQGDTHWNIGVQPDGLVSTLSPEEVSNHSLLSPGTDVAQLISLYPVGPFATGIYDFEHDGRIYKLPPGKSWPSPREGMERLSLAGRLQPYDSGRSLRYLLHLSDYPVGVYTNVWSDTSAPTGMRFVVETSPKVVQRCVLMTTDPGDLVLDPTCGSGTTSYVSERWGRRWITIDSSRVALALTRERLASAVFPYFVLADSPEGQTAEAELIGGPVSTAPTQRNVRHGFVYQRALHLTLGAIANNPDIRPGMSRDEVARAIRRHADYEPLFDQPVQDSSKVRVAGPFTVETLSPHRALATGGSPWSLAAGDGHASSNENGRFEEIIRDNLAASGIQNGRRSERLTFDTVSPYAASHIQFVGEREQVTDGGPRRAGISVGPQYGTVGPSFIKEAAREAIRAQDIDLLCVLAFAFDPSVLGTGDDYVTSDEGFAEVAAERQLGRVPVLLVRMNADLVMGQDLKTAPNANLFTVFGEPDVDVLREGELLRVVLHGVDVYDPNTGELRSRSTDRIALWMIDSDYNGESFFVRHCYFTGGNDPYAKLKRALRAEIDEAAWSSLYRTESLPFDRPETGKIAVKVINDYGDEVVKVIAV